MIKPTIKNWMREAFKAGLWEGIPADVLAQLKEAQAPKEEPKAKKVKSEEAA